MTDDLIARLKAHLDEDERVALAAKTGYPGLCDHDKTGRWGFDGIGVGDENGEAVVEDHGSHPEITPHIARHDPARVLRWVKAAREILEWYDEITEGLDLSGYDEFGSLKDLPVDRSLAVTLAVEAVRALASVYGDEAG